MNPLDIVIIIVLIAPTFIGLKIGLIKMAFSLVGLIVGVVLASNYYESVGGVFGFIPNSAIANIIAFVLILIIVMVIATIASNLLKSVIKFTMLGWVDYLGGAVLAFIAGVILISAVLATLVKLFGTGLVTESLLAGILLDKFPLILGLLPEEFNTIRNFFQ